MKKSLLLVVLVMASVFTYAQNDKNIGFIVKGGVNLSRVTASGEGTEAVTDSMKFNPSFNLSALVNIKLSEMLALQPGLNFSGKGFKIKGSAVDGDDYATGEIRQNLLYLELPVNLVANFKAGSGNVFIGAGPYYAIALSGKNKYKESGVMDGEPYSDSDSEDVTIGSDAGDMIKSSDYGINFLGGYQFKFGLSINAGYGLGLANIANGATDNSSLKNRVLSFGLGYSF